ncbi:MAG: leucine-rich repeat domain-containing protein [bacterium]|jgi:Leucine-rich repeat (LRR) protein
MTTAAHYQAMIRDGVLDLSDTDISDLSPLAGLTGLHTLDLSDTEVSDASVGELRRILPNLWINQ